MASILRYCFLMIAAMLLCAASTANALHFYLKGSTQTCFGQDIIRDANENSVRVDVYYNVHYSQKVERHLYKKDAAKMTVFLGNAEQKPVKGTETVVPLTTSANEVTSYYAAQSGFYFFCFQVDGPKTSSYKAEVEIIPISKRGDATQVDPTAPANSKRNKKTLDKRGVSKESYLRKINAIDALLLSSEEEMSHLLDRQRQFDGTVISTHNRVIYFTLANAIIVFGTAGWQMLHLKRFFKSKKVV